MIFLLFLTYQKLAVSTAKVICITTESSLSDSNLCTDLFYSYTSDMVLNTMIENVLSGADSVNIYLYTSFFGSFDYKISLNIFGTIPTHIEIKSFSVTATLSVGPGLENSEISLQGSSSDSAFTIDGTTSLKMKSLSLFKLTLDKRVTEIDVDYFQILDSVTHFITKFNVNQLVKDIKTSNNVEVTFSKDKMDIESVLFNFHGINQSITLIHSTSYDFLLNNQYTDSNDFPNFKLIKARCLSFKGIPLIESNSIVLESVRAIITDSSILPIHSLEFSSSFTLTISQSIRITGNLMGKSYSDRVIVEIPKNMEIKNRISVTVPGITGLVEIKSSWIDLHTDNFQFFSDSFFKDKSPISPCVGVGGASLFTATNVASDGQINVNNIKVFVDLVGTQTDETLSTLQSKDWEMIVLSGYKINPEKTFSISFDPSSINGFTSDSSKSIIQVWSTFDSDAKIIVKANSYNSIPLVLCYNVFNCPGTKIDDLNLFHTYILEKSQKVTLLFSGGITTLDLSAVVGNDKTIHFNGTMFSSSMIASLNLGNAFNTVYFKDFAFGGEITLVTKYIFFENCQGQSSAKLFFSNLDSEVTFVDNCFLDLERYLSNSVMPLTSIKSISDTIEITNDYYSFYSSSTSTFFSQQYSRIKFPKMNFKKIESILFSDPKYEIRIKATKLDHLGFIFNYLLSSPRNLNLNLIGLNDLSSANIINISCGNFITTVNLNDSPKKSYLTVTGESVKFINEGSSSINSNLCACRQLPCNGCDRDYTEVSFSELDTKINENTENIHIMIIGDGPDGEPPIVKVNSMNGKDAIIIGKENTNAKIKIDNLNEPEITENKIDLIGLDVSINSVTKLVLSVLVLTNCNLDSSFNNIPLLINALECQSNNFVFQSIEIKESLIVNQGLAIYPHTLSFKSTISFGISSTFSMLVPYNIRFENSNLIIDSTTFEINNINATLSLISSENELTIEGNLANIEASKNILIKKSIKQTILNINGTWSTETPTKFITIDKTSDLDLLIGGNNLPFVISSLQPKTLIITQEITKVIGSVNLDKNFNLKITKLNTSNVSLTFNKFEVSISTGFIIEEPNIIVNIDSVYSSSSKDFRPTSYLDLEGSSVINIKSVASSIRIIATIKCGVTQSLNDPRMKDFITQNHTMITFPKTFQQTSASIIFADDSTHGFNNNNFMHMIKDGEIIFYNTNSPYDEVFEFCYKVFSCSAKAKIIEDKDFSMLENYIYVENANVILSVGSDIIGNNQLDFDKPSISIDTLNIKSVSFSSSLLTIQMKLGSNKVKSLSTESIIISTVNPNNNFIVQKVQLYKGSYISENIDISNINEIVCDEKSTLNIKHNEFSNILRLKLNSIKTSVKFFSDGLNISYSNSFVFLRLSPSSNINIECDHTTPTFSVASNVSDIPLIHVFAQQLTSLYLGENWNLVSPSSKIDIVFDVEPTTKTLTVQTSSFPFEAWGIMDKCLIDLSSTEPIIEDKITVSGKTLTFNTGSTFWPKNIIFSDVTLENNGCIMTKEDSAKETIFFSNLHVKENSNSTIMYSIIKDSLKLGPNSILNGSYITSSTMNTKIELKWELHSISFINSSFSQKNIPSSIMISFVGEENIAGKEEDYNQFLKDGHLIGTIKDKCPEWLSKISYNSSNPYFSSSLNDNVESELVLSSKCERDDLILFLEKEISANDKKTSIIDFPEENTNESYINDDVIPIESNFEDKNETTSRNNDQEDVASETIEEKEDFTTPTLNINDSSVADTENEETEPTYVITTEPTDVITTEPTNVITTEPTYAITAEPTNDMIENGMITIDYSHTSLSNEIIFTENGYKENENSNEISIISSEADIIVVKAESESLILKTSIKQSKRKLYVLPLKSNSFIKIEHILTNDGEVGIQIDENKPVIQIESNIAPLNILCTSKNSQTTIKSSNSLNIKEKQTQETTLSLSDMISIDADLNIIVSYNNIEEVEINNIQSFNDSSIAIIDEKSNKNVDIKIKGRVEVKRKSSLHLSQISVNNEIKIEQDAILEIEKSITFSEDSNIKLFKSSFIHLGQSNIKGIVNELKLLENIDKTLETKGTNESILICGSTFECSTWIEKFSSDDSTLNLVKCEKNIENEMCLIAYRDIKNSGDDPTKEGEAKSPLGTSAIIGIVIGVIAVIAIIIGTVLYLRKRNSKNHSNYDNASFFDGNEADEESIQI